VTATFVTVTTLGVVGNTGVAAADAVTATNSVGTSAASPSSNPVNPAPPPTLTLPPSAADGSTFIEDVFVDNNGPATATNLDTVAFIPAGLTVIAAAGATGVTINPSTVTFTDRSLLAGYSRVYGITLKVDAHAITPIGAVVADDGYDPYLFNNAAITTIQLLPSNS
jgi:Domain of unknown function DUF11